MNLDRYFFAMKHQEVKQVRAAFEEALGYAARHVEHRDLQAVLSDDAFGDWVVAPRTPQQAAMLLMAPPPTAVVPGAVHRLQKAMARLQILRANWPKAL